MLEEMGPTERSRRTSANLNSNQVSSPVASDSASLASSIPVARRIHLGIHWSFDETKGIVQGKHVADFVFDNICLAAPWGRRTGADEDEPAHAARSLAPITSCTRVQSAPRREQRHAPPAVQSVRAGRGRDGRRENTRPPRIPAVAVTVYSR
jgi:hypothetical protein